jgi:hypothetical protein
MRSLFHRVKAVGNYLAERREADRFQPEGWETAEGRALLNQYRTDGVGQGAKAGLNGWDAADGSTGPMPGPPVRAAAAPAVDAAGLIAPVEIAGPAEPSVGRGVARVPRQRTTDVTRPVGESRGVARVTPPASDEGTPPVSKQGEHPASNEVARPAYIEFALPATRAPATREPASNGVARPASGEPASKNVARHGSDDVAVQMNHRPRHDGTQAQVESGYLLSREPATRHGDMAGPDGARVLTITNVVRGPDGSPLAGAIVTISLFADCATPGFQPDSTIDGVARIITPEEGELIAEWTPESEVVAMNTHYQVAELTEDWPEGRDLVRSRAGSHARQD